MKKFLLSATIVALILVLLGLLGPKGDAPTDKAAAMPHSVQALSKAPVSAVGASNSAAAHSAKSEEIIAKAGSLDGPFRDKFLRAISATNAAFQAWGKEKMLDEVNRALSRVEMFGIKGPLNASNVIGTAQLFSGMNTDKYQLWLHTSDHTHRFRYEDGRLWEMYAVQGDYLRNGNRQLDQAMAEWAQLNGQWTDAEARRAFDQLLKRLEVPLDPNGAGNRVEIEPFEIEIGNKTLTPFYTVRLIAEGNIVRAEVHFRSTTSGWQPTLINFRIRGQADNEPAAADLIRRFF